MLKANDITQAIETAFINDPEFSDFTIVRGDFVNTDPDVCPWLGIYRQSINYSPETLGNGPDYWTAIATIKLIVQAAHLNSAEECEDQLEEYVESVVSKIFSDTTIRASVDMVNQVDVSYSYIAEDEETLYHQSAMIDLTLEVSTS